MTRRDVGMVGLGVLGVVSAVETAVLADALVRYELVIRMNRRFGRAVLRALRGRP